MPTIAGIKLLVKDIITLSNVLPQSVSQGTKDDKIWNVMKLDDRDTAYETFKMRFDAMFGEDCRDSGGRLQYISRGKYGIGCVCSYLAKIDWSDHFPLDLVEIKLQRLITELRHICGSDADLTSQARPSRHIAPTSKLTDSNNAARPELTFQRKAVQEFRMRQAQEAGSLLKPSGPDVTSPTEPTRNHDLFTRADADGERDGSDDEGVDEQPKPCKKRRIMPSTNADCERDGSDDGGVDEQPKPCKKRRIMPSTASALQTKRIVTIITLWAFPNDFAD
ncbi:hypothetical protein BJV78DRAFT_1281338 [Lactifluus subvellereus]|nr:hypothetical protein BJV78DRAFT_1281338 [Lactifluus subvellereus]